MVAVLVPKGGHGRLPLHQLEAQLRRQHRHQRRFAAAGRAYLHRNRCSYLSAHAKQYHTIKTLLLLQAGWQYSSACASTLCIDRVAQKQTCEEQDTGGHACPSRLQLQRKPAAHLLHLLFVHDQVNSAPGCMACHPPGLPGCAEHKRAGLDLNLRFKTVARI